MSAIEAVCLGTPILIDTSRVTSEAANIQALVDLGCACEMFGESIEGPSGNEWTEAHVSCLRLTRGNGCMLVAQAIEEML